MKYLPIFAALAATAVAKTAITNALYQKIIYYAQLSAAADLAAPCMSTKAAPPYGIPIQAQLDTPFNGTDVHATIFRNDTTKEFVLAFAATNNTVNFLEDLDIALTPPNGNFPCTGGCKFHNGFQIAYGLNTDQNALAGKVHTALAAAVNKYPTYTLTITGASLGGALTSLAYSDLVQLYKSKITGVYTYGEPRVGNVAAAAHVDSIAGASTFGAAGLYHRVTHADDIVPRLPPQGPAGPDQYTHSLTEYWQSVYDGDSNTAATTYQCVGAEDPGCNDGTPFDIPTGVNAHGDYAGFKAVVCTNNPRMRFMPRDF